MPRMIRGGGIFEETDRGWVADIRVLPSILPGRCGHRPLHLLILAGLLDFCGQLARAKAQSKRKTPDRFEVGLLASCFDHAQMRARDTSKPAEQLLRHILFHPKPPDRLADGALLILHMIASFPA